MEAFAHFYLSLAWCAITTPTTYKTKNESKLGIYSLQSSPARYKFIKFTTRMSKTTR